MNARLAAEVDRAIETLARRLDDLRIGDDHWEGSLASSALSTGTAVLALHLASAGHARADELRRGVGSGIAWLVEHQNADGGWGDTVRSGSNISTTAIVWAALSAVATYSAIRGRLPTLPESLDVLVQRPLTTQVSNPSP